MDSDIRKQFANKIIKLRKEKGLSQEELAFEAKIDRSYMSRIERGLVSTSIIKISKIAKALNVEPFELLKLDKNDFIGIIDCKKQSLSKEQLNIQKRAIITNFIDHLTDYLEEEQKIRKTLEKEVNELKKQCSIESP